MLNFLEYCQFLMNIVLITAGVGEEEMTTIHISLPYPTLTINDNWTEYDDVVGVSPVQSTQN